MHSEKKSYVSMSLLVFSVGSILIVGMFEI